MNFEQTWRWYGPDDPVTLRDIKQTGATGIVNALHHIPIGEVWSKEEINLRKEMIEEAGFRWSVVESLPVHEDIKTRSGSFETYIENYKKSLKNLAECGIDTVCYNFMAVLDWNRTELNHPLDNGATALRFDITALAAFELFKLNRPGADQHYSNDQIEKSREYYNKLSESSIDDLQSSILAGLPGSEVSYDPEEFIEALDTYEDIDDETLRQNLAEFLKEVVPTARENGIRLAIHPDDPPFSIFGLPRAVSTQKDAENIINAVDDISNGLTFCTGSYGARKDNNLPEMAKRLGHRINFIHFRNVHIEDENIFVESDHLDGDLDLTKVMTELIREQQNREKNGRKDIRIPFRPDHGHRMLDDLRKKVNAGYSCIGRMKGLAELRGLETGIRKTLEN